MDKATAAEKIRVGTGLGRAADSLDEATAAFRALGAMPIAAGVVGDLDMRALLTAQDMPAQRRRAAALDRRYHLELFEAYMAGIGTTPCRTMLAENIRELERRTRHARRVRRAERPP